MTIFDIPDIQCDEDSVKVMITLDCEKLCGIMEYLGGRRDGDAVVFGSTEI